jgi:hypothetical protein
LPTLGDLADAEIANSMRSLPGDVSSLEKDIAPSWSVHAEYCTDERAFASAIRADDRHHLALRDFNRDAIESLRVTVKQIKIADLQHWGYGFSTALPR